MNLIHSPRFSAVLIVSYVNRVNTLAVQGKQTPDSVRKVLQTCRLPPARVSQFRERHSRTAPSLLAVKEISKKTRRDGSSEFSLSTAVTKNSSQCPFLVIGTCRTLRGTLIILNFTQSDAAESLPPETGFSISLSILSNHIKGITLASA